MGCDIHVKTFVYSKVEKKMVPAMSVFEDSKYFPQIVEDRDYDLFGLFGNSCRSWYPELDCFEIENDFPSFMKKTTLYKRINIGDYHTRRWCYADKLEASLKEYKENLLDPEKWLKRYGDNNDDFLLDIAQKKVSAKKWKESNQCLIASIDEVLKKIEDVKMWIGDYSDILDPEKIVFVTWMDS